MILLVNISDWGWIHTPSWGIQIPKMNSAGEHVVGQAPLHGGVSRPQASRGSSWRGNHPPLTYHKCLGFKPSPLRLWRWLYHLRFLLDFWDHVYGGLKLDQFRPGNPVEDPVEDPLVGYTSPYSCWYPQCASLHHPYGWLSHHFCLDPMLVTICYNAY